MPFPVMAVMAGVSIAGTLFGAYQQRKAAQAQAAAYIRQGTYNKMMSEYRGELIREQSREKADRIFDAANRLRGRQVVAQANAGIVIGEGSAAAVVEDTQSLAARDALVTLYSGIAGQQAELQQGEMQHRSAMHSARSSYQQADAAMISGITRAAGMYHTYKSFTTPRSQV